MVRFLKAAILLSFACFVIGHGPNALAQSLAPIASVEAVLEDSAGFAKFKSFVLGASADDLVPMRNFLRGRGLRDAEITKAIGDHDAVALKGMIEQAVPRAGSDPALIARINNAALHTFPVSGAELAKASKLSLGAGRPGDGAQLPGRAAMIRSANSKGAIDFGKMGNPQKYGPPIPVGPVANPVQPFAIESIETQVAEIEKNNGGLSSALKRTMDRYGVGDDFYTDCFGARGKNGQPGTLLEEGPRHVLEHVLESADTVSPNDPNLAVAVAEAGIKVLQTETFRTRTEAIEAEKTIAEECAWLPPIYGQGLALILN